MIKRRDALKLMAVATVWSSFKTRGYSTMLTEDSILNRKIPSTGQPLPVIGLGTWQTFDVNQSEAERSALREVIKTLVDKGASVIDSSPMYGSSEEVVGDLSTELKNRDKLFLATKVWTSGRQAGIDQMKSSFRKMRAEKMDLMQVHNLTDVRTHLKTLRAMKEEGTIKYFGITHYLTSAYPELIRLLKNEKPDFVQFNYNLAVREAEKELLPLAKDIGVGVIVNRPFEEGALFIRVRSKNLPDWAADYDIKSWGQFFLKFIVSHPAVTCAIPGTSKVKHLKDNLAAGFGQLPDDVGRKKMIKLFNQL
jgi:diketogulonate reductase-like aldo/keto reductase